MTEKQKAEELVERFMGINQFLNPENTNQKQAAKWCALISVGYSIERIKAMYLKNYGNTIDFKATGAYSEEVKSLGNVIKEIEAL